MTISGGGDGYVVQVAVVAVELGVASLQLFLHQDAPLLESVPERVDRTRQEGDVPHSRGSVRGAHDAKPLPHRSVEFVRDTLRR